jgi:RHS repeat-associated protein
MGRTTNYEYDAQGRLTVVVQPGVTDPATGQTVRPRTEYTYDNYGDLLTQKDALGRVTGFTYDPFGHQTSRTLPQGQGDPAPPTETMTYDNFGDLATHTDFAGNETVFHYDPALGRLTEQDVYAAGHNPATSPPDQQITTQYDPLGRVSQVTDSAYGTLTSAYDADNRLTSVVSPQGEVDYAYDPATGRRTSTTTANSGVQYGYDALGRLTSVHLVKSGGVNLVAAGTDQTQSYTYDDANNLTHSELDQGASVLVTADYTYDSLNRVRTLVQKAGAGNQLASYSCLRLADGRLSQVDESLVLPSGSTRTDTVKYAYDALGRLTEEALTSSDTSLNRTTDYTLDLVGNRLKQVTTTPGGTETITDTYDARDRLLSEADSVNGGPSQTTSFGYDVNGNLTGTTNPNGSTVAYTFDLRGRMVQAVTQASGGGVLSSESLTYNPDGIRTGSTLTQGGTTTTSRYLIDALNPTGYAQVLEESNGGGALVASYLYGLAPVSQVRGGQVSYYLLDGHSGVRQLLSASDVVAAAYLYDAFGDLLSSAGSVADPLLYRGEWFDATLGEYYLRARFYNPATGRFDRLDPFAGNRNDPPSLHKYAYTHGDPVDGTDPSGRCLIGIALACLESLNLRITVAKAKIAAGGGGIFLLRGLERMQQLLNILISRGQTLLAWEQRIVDASGNFIGRFRIDALVQRTSSSGQQVNTMIESKGVRWDLAAANSNGWQSFLTQITRQGEAFSRATQTADGVAIQERWIVFTSRIPPGLEERAADLITRLSPYYQRIFWGFQSLEEAL